MRLNTAIHWLAVAALGYITAAFAVNVVIAPVGSLAQRPLVSALLALGFWVLVTWKVWKQPRRWGFGVGIVLFVSLAFQIYLWRLAVASPRRDPNMDYTTLGFIISTIPYIVAGVCCVLLKWFRPDEQTNPA